MRDSLQRLRLGHLAERLDALLSAAARDEPTYLHFLDGLLSEEMGSKQRNRVAMGMTAAEGVLRKLPLLRTAKRTPPTGAWKTLRVSHSSPSTLLRE